MPIIFGVSKLALLRDGVLGSPVMTPDTTPDAFSFSPVTGANQSQQYTSNAITILGINAPAALVLSGDASGEYRITRSGTPGAWSTAPTVALVNDIIEVRENSAGGPGLGASVTLTVGGVASTYTVTTSGTSSGPSLDFSDPDNSQNIPLVL